MDAKEAELVNEEFLKTGNTYNLKLGGEGGFDFCNKNLSKEDRKVRGDVGYQTLKNLHNNIEYKKLFYEEAGKRIKELHKQGVFRHDGFLGKSHTEDTKKKMSITQKNIDRTGKNNPSFGTCMIYSESEKRTIRIKKDDIQKWLDEGWIKGAKYKF
jgi:hypothetical protein